MESAEATASSGSAIATLVERASGYTFLVHLPGRHAAEVTTRALIRGIGADGVDGTDGAIPHTERAATKWRRELIAAFTVLPPGLCRTLTWDRGIELADHAKVAAATGLEIFFADPHSPWQRGSNENTNGLARQYFPKGTNLAVQSPERLEQVQDELNGRPCERHDWATPTAKLAALQSRIE